MHFAAYVITAERPTPEVLEAALAPFREQKFDWYALGGRYSGNIIPIEGADTLTGSDEPHPFELKMQELLVEMREESGGDLKFVRDGVSHGPGVDACQIQNIESLRGRGGAPLAVIVGGEWHQCPVYPIEASLRARGIPVDDIMEPEPDVEVFGGIPEDGKGVSPEEMREWIAEEQAAVAERRELIKELMAPICPQHWLSLIDLHN